MHEMKVENRQTSTCSAGCCTSYGDFVVCTCGWEKQVYEPGEYKHNTRPAMSSLVMLEHRVDILEKTLASPSAKDLAVSYSKDMAKTLKKNISKEKARRK